MLYCITQRWHILIIINVKVLVTAVATDISVGLKLIAIQNGMNVPELHMDPTYSKALHFNLSTSQVLRLIIPVAFNSLSCIPSKSGQHLFCGAANLFPQPALHV